MPKDLDGLPEPDLWRLAQDTWCEKSVTDSPWLHWGGGQWTRDR